MEGVQPAVTMDDCFLAEELLKKNAEFASFVEARYGVTDLDLLACDPWYSGIRCAKLWPAEHSCERWEGSSEGSEPCLALPALVRFGAPAGRLFQFFLYLRSCPDDNFYAHPLDCVVFYDLHADKVTNVTVYGPAADRGKAAIPSVDSNFHRDAMDVPWRGGIKPLDIVQPEGPSFTVQNGNDVEWQNWSFKVGFSWREGLILHNVGYSDGRVRPVIYRAALAEIIVPYGA